MKEDFIQKVFKRHQSSVKLPMKEKFTFFIDDLLKIMFPTLGCITAIREPHEIAQNFDRLKKEMIGIMKLKGDAAPDIVEKFFASLPEAHEKISADAKAIAAGDPAAQSEEEVISTYPGFFAIAVYRLSNILYGLEVPTVARMLAEYAHSQTGIDIHPGATIGKDFCIDHGTGIVIGETTHIGDNVKIYQGVTLGALSVEKHMAALKRHPTIEDDVIIYAGATILGGNTTVGNHSVIGGNVWLTRTVPPHSRVYHKAQINLSQDEDPADIINFSI